MAPIVTSNKQLRFHVYLKYTDSALHTEHVATSTAQVSRVNTLGT